MSFIKFSFISSFSYDWLLLCCRIDDPRPLEGRLEPNDILDAGERILDGKIVGPESVASKSDDEIFVSLHGGKILRIWGKRFDHFKIITSIGPGCGEWQQEGGSREEGLVWFVTKYFRSEDWELWLKFMGN